MVAARRPGVPNQRGPPAAGPPGARCAAAGGCRRWPVRAAFAPAASRAVRCSPAGRRAAGIAPCRPGRPGRRVPLVRRGGEAADSRGSCARAPSRWATPPFTALERRSVTAQCGGDDRRAPGELRALPRTPRPPRARGRGSAGGPREDAAAAAARPRARMARRRRLPAHATRATRCSSTPTSRGSRCATCCAARPRCPTRRCTARFLPAATGRGRRGPRRPHPLRPRRRRPAARPPLRRRPTARARWST